MSTIQKYFKSLKRLFWDKRRKEQGEYTMRVSVVVPFHKGIHYLEDCLESLSKQTIREFEVI